MSRVLNAIFTGVFAMAASSALLATPITFTGSSGSLAGSVTFDVVAGNLQVTLTNTSASDANAPADVLTAIFFDLASVGTLTPISGLLNVGSIVVYDADGQPAGGVIGGEWAYKDGLAGPGGATEGISSSGFSLFGPPDLFPGPDLAPPTSPDGLQYGLLPAGWVTGGDNGGLTGSGGLIQNSVVFTLSGLPAGFDPSATGAITNVSFQYGTALTEPNIPGGSSSGSSGSSGSSSGSSGTIPEPNSNLLSLLGIGMLAAAMWSRRRSRRA